MRSHPYLSRRSLLSCLGASAALLPLVNAESDAAQDIPKRLIVVMWGEGSIAEAFWPRGGADLAAQNLPAITAPLEPYKSDLIFVDDVEMMNFTDYPDHGAGHENYACTFTGVQGYEGYRDSNGPRYLGGGPSIDQVIAKQLAGTAPVAFPSLHFGAQVSQGGLEFFKRCFYRDVMQPIAPDEDPTHIFDTLFTGPAMADPELLRLRAERRSLLDFVGRDIERFAGQVGARDKDKILGYLASVRELETRLAFDGTGCSPPNVLALDPDDNDSYPAIVEAELDLAVAALACDLTRVLTIQLNDASSSGLVFNWLPELTSKNETFDPGGPRNYHDLAHHPGPDGAEKIKVDRWYMTLFAGLLERLKRVPEGAGTLLDNSVVLWMNHMGNGGGHSSNRLPCILAGSCGGYFKTGRYIKPAERVPTNQVLVALANAMGATMTSFGDPKYGGELAALRA